MPQRVRPDRFGDPGAEGDPADDPGGAVPVQPLPLGGKEDRPVYPLTHGQVDRPRRPQRYRAEVCGLDVVPQWVVANVMPQGAPPEDAAIDLDALLGSLARRSTRSR
jgi:hypothetical protein